MRTSIAGGNAYEVDSGICARLRYRSGLPLRQDSISGADRYFVPYLSANTLLPPDAILVGAGMQFRPFRFVLLSKRWPASPTTFAPDRGLPKQKSVRFFLLQRVLICCRYR